MGVAGEHQVIALLRLPGRGVGDSPAHLLSQSCGLGPLGAAFYVWDMALKRGDARRIGILSYLTPLASTALLLLLTGRPPTGTIALAAALVVAAAVLGGRAR